MVAHTLVACSVALVIAHANGSNDVSKGIATFVGSGVTDLRGVLVFFMSWCPVCARELPVVQDAVNRSGDGVTAIGVALDDDDTWARVEDLVRRERFALPIVRGADYKDFLDVYDASRAFPLVIVLDANGRVSFSQRSAPGDSGARLEQAIAHARARDSLPPQ